MRQIVEQESNKEVVSRYIKGGFKLLLGYLCAATVAVVLFFIAFLTLLESNIGMMVYTCVFTFVAFGFVYQDAYKLATHDTKPFYQISHYPLKGFVYAIVPLVITALIVLLWQFVHTENFTESARLGRWQSKVVLPVQFFFTAYTFPFHSFMEVEGGIINGYAYVMIFLVPFLSSGLGYFAGLKKFSIYDRYIHKMIYKINPKMMDSKHKKKKHPKAE